MRDLGCLGFIPSWFRLFRHDSRPIFACFSRFGRRPIQLDSGWTSPIRCESKSSRCELRKKIKKAQMLHWRIGSRVRCRTPCRVTLDSNAVPSQLRRCFRAFWRWGWFWKLCLQEIALVFFFKFLFIFIIIIINFFFAGSMHDYVQPALLQNMKDKSPNTKIFGQMPKSSSINLLWTQGIYKWVHGNIS